MFERKMSVQSIHTCILNINSIMTYLFIENILLQSLILQQLNWHIWTGLTVSTVVVGWISNRLKYFHVPALSRKSVVLSSIIQHAMT